MAINRTRINRLTLSELLKYSSVEEKIHKENYYPFFKPVPNLSLLKPVIPHYL